MSAHRDEAEVFRKEEPAFTVERGTVGWADASDHHDLGSDDNDGTTLVRVTIFRGSRATGKSPQDGVANGLQVLAQVSGPFWAVPPPGQAVLVAFPGGDIETPGNGIIMCWLGKSPSVQFKYGRAVVDVGDQDLIVKGKSVTLSDRQAPAQFIQVGPPPQGGASGITACDSQGGGFTVQAGVAAMFSGDGAGHAPTLVQVTTTSFEVWQKDGGCLMVKGGNASMIAPNCYVRGNVFLGKAPVVGNFAAVYPLVGGVPAPSTSVVISL